MQPQDVSWLDWLTQRTGELSGLLWNNSLTLILLVGTGLYLTLRLGFIQLHGFRHSMALVSGRYSSHRDVGEVSHFQALSTALSATVGTGNIAGVATAIALGGPGALFWMWVTAFVGMATKFTECTLSLKFREVGPDGRIAGGPMYTLLSGLNMRFLAVLFALFAMVASFGIGNMVQANSVVDGLGYLFAPLIQAADMSEQQARDLFKEEYGWVIGLVMAVLVGLVIIGGVRRIARVASTLVPFMAILYIAAALFVLANHLTDIPGAFATIFNRAMNVWAVGGAAVGEAIRWGVARGLFSNEAGLGSSPMAHAAARTNEPVREGLVAMLEPFIDTLVICTMTGLVIVITGAWGEARPAGLEGAALTAHAFTQTLEHSGSAVVGLGLTLFAFSTMIAWSYYGDRSAHFLFGERAVLHYRIVFVVLVVFGAAVPLKLVWNLADITNILMALPNLLSLILLAGLVKRLRDDYFARPQAPTNEMLSDEGPENGG
ncbi:MAG: alanine:cation symporter family protein [Gammaproteobacteria bacterium]|nr:alanine:cation symporter family protein [Gammaproteobacteria bacterium]NIR97318.1 alanine:cation symporter family protein [Gammaproteobacteria bacterium]NIT63361.1 alanine:cation symporter family protein [Gammaproteobacteria bacterium]NIV20288.1 amino acid carrier protein [Gammaproteobacteria bacterium]NIX10705.1 amino acid carrier protein [Gammaproteobacteria bacterium]